MEVNVNVVDENLTPILYLCWKNRDDQLLECIKTLLYRDDLDLNSRDSGKCWNALPMVCRHFPGNCLFDIVRLLLDRGIEINSVDHNRINALIAVCANYKHSNLIDIVRLLLGKKINVNAVSKETGWNALIYLCRNYDGPNLVDIARLLLQHESKMDPIGNKEGNALIVACQSYNHGSLIDVVRLFLQHGIDVNATDPTLGANALINLCSYYKEENLLPIIEILLNAGRNINARARDQSNALLALAILQPKHRDFIKILRLFIERCIDVHACNDDGWNVVHNLCNSSACGHFTEAISILKLNGVDLKARNNDGKMPVNVLNKTLKKKKEIVKLLQ